MCFAHHETCQPLGVHFAMLIGPFYHLMAKHGWAFLLDENTVKAAACKTRQKLSG